MRDTGKKFQYNFEARLEIKWFCQNEKKKKKKIRTDLCKLSKYCSSFSCIDYKKKTTVNEVQWTTPVS